MMSDSLILQVVDGKGDILPEFEQKLANSPFINKGFDYTTVSVLGVQSSGKSTLMNKMFDMNFHVMDARRGRNRTTEGIWLGICFGKSGTFLLMDVEGTDSRERGENHGQFERKTSLLSMALSDILIINMWTTDIGRHEGANYGLLRIVFELNLRLFQNSKSVKTLILFLFRDHSQDEDSEPFSSLRQMVESDMNAIWSSISKGSEYENTELYNFFEFNFFSLPSMKYQSKEFDRQIEILKQRFFDEDNPRYFFASRKEMDKTKRFKDVPADGFSKYVQDIWQVIKENKDLNLPSQKEMLSLFRCEQIGMQILEEFTVVFNEIIREHKNSDNGLITENVPQTGPFIGSKIDKLIRDSLDAYSTQTSHYQDHAREMKKKLLIEKLGNECLKFINERKKLILEKIDIELNNKVKDVVPVDELNTANRYNSAIMLEELDFGIEDFLKSISSVRNSIDTMLEFELNVMKVDYFEQEFCTCSSTRELVSNLLNENFVALKVKKVDSIIFIVNMYLKDQFFLWISQWVVGFDGDAFSGWEIITDRYERSKADLLSRMKADFDKLELPESSLSLIQKKVQIEFSTTFKASIHKLRENIDWLMEKKFNSKFKYGPDRVPRKWGLNDNLDGEFKKACNSAGNLLDMLSVMRVEGNYSWFFLDKNGCLQIKESSTCIPKQLILMDFTSVLRSMDHFKTFADSAYSEALYQQRSGEKRSNTLIVAMIMFLIFGWDEFLTILSNPILFFLSIIFASSLSLVLYFNLTGSIFGYLRNIVFFLSGSAKYENVERGTTKNNSPSAIAHPSP